MGFAVQCWQEFFFDDVDFLKVGVCMRLVQVILSLSLSQAACASKMRLLMNQITWMKLAKLKTMSYKRCWTWMMTKFRQR